MGGKLILNSSIALTIAILSLTSNRVENKKQLKRGAGTSIGHVGPSNVSYT